LKNKQKGILSENATQVNLYKIEQKSQNELMSKDTIHYSKYIKNSVPLSSFSWHSKDYNQLMVISVYNGLMDLTVTDFLPIAFSANDCLNIVTNDKVSMFNIKNEEDDLDIGEKMKYRAVNSYGVQDFLLNIELLSEKNENDVRYLWQWMHQSQKIIQNNSNFEKFIGIKNILAQQINRTSSSSSFANNQILNKSLILKLCSWENWQELVKTLIDQGQIERAACICVFNKDLNKAIEILNEHSGDMNEYVALSLSLKFIKKQTNNNNKSLVQKLTNPYLKALFSYQIDNECFDNQIYNDSNISICDRVCMAMAILSTKPEQLYNFINKLTSDCMKQGNLYGIVLTGLTGSHIGGHIDCIDLFQAYIHRTSDVQTPATVIIHSSFIKDLSSKYIDEWIESYRELLDYWMLWEER
jgi:WD repeat-containing protein mio